MPRIGYHTGFALAALLYAQACLADTTPSSFTANIGLSSLYKYRGQDQYLATNGRSRAVRPALQGGLDYTSAQGWYLGNWNSSVRLSDKARVEMDFYGGTRFATGPIAWDLGVLRYQYPREAALNTTEVYAAGTYEELALKYSHTVSSRYFGLEHGRGTGYLNLAWNHPLSKGVTLQAAAGRTLLPSEVRASGLANYTDYSLGLAWEFQTGFTLSAAVAGADQRHAWGDINRPRAIVGVKATF